MQELTSQAPRHTTPIKPVGQMNQKRAYEIAQSQKSSKVFVRLNNMKKHQQQLKVARSTHLENHSNKSEAARRRSSNSSSNLSQKQ